MRRCEAGALKRCIFLNVESYNHINAAKSKTTDIKINLKKSGDRKCSTGQMAVPEQKQLSIHSVETGRFS